MIIYIAVCVVSEHLSIVQRFSETFNCDNLIFMAFGIVAGLFMALFSLTRVT